ncbi:MAG: hypothetical protein WCY88_09050 [Spongiibacteraceae bacterium]
MLDLSFLVYVIGELAAVLLVVSIFLLWHTNKLKKLVRQLEDKIISLRKSISLSRNETKVALKKLAEQEAVPSKTYIDYLDEEIDGSRDYHQSLNPDRDIVLDIAPDAPVERQAAALRHAYLIAEKEARYAGDDDGSNWDVLQAKLQQIIHFYESTTIPAVETVLSDQSGASSDEEIQDYKRRIENLERFKNLFFEMEAKWQIAKSRAEEYRHQLLALGSELGAGDDFNGLLERYAASFDDVGNLIAGAIGKHAEGGIEADLQREGVGRVIITNQEEMQRLHNMAVDQHKVINQLKRKLLDAATTEQQQQVVEDLTRQLESQQQFLKEMEVCTQLIEDELARALAENETLRLELQGKSAGVEEGVVDDIESVVSDLTIEGEEMLATIAALGVENQSLKQQLDKAEASVENTAMLKEKLSGMQQELLNLQAQHIELEERYLELKMS